MIRRIFITSVMLAVTAAVAWEFVTGALLYNPLSEVGASETAPAGRAMSKEDFKAAWGKAILEANLFSQERGAPPETPKPSEAAAPTPVVPEVKPQRPVLELDGIIVNRFGEYVAYVKKDSKDAVPLRVGDMLDGVKVQSIDERTVELVWLGEKIELFMTKIETLTR